MRIEGFATSDRGRKRERNEDFHALDEGGGLVIVADGMGGHAAGDVASRMATEAVVERFWALQRDLTLPYAFPSDPAHSLEERALAEAIRYANHRVYVESEKNPRYEGMGTTLVALFVGDDGIVVAHVGDSRIYRIRGGALAQVTEDHSQINHLIKTQGLTEAQARAQALGKNVIVRAIGLRADVEPEVRTLEPEEGDVFLLCTDGLTDLVEDWLIEETAVAAEGDLPALARRLVERANHAGGKDNITVAAVQVVDVGPRTLDRPAPRRRADDRLPTRRVSLPEADTQRLEQDGSEAVTLPNARIPAAILEPRPKPAAASGPPPPPPIPRSTPAPAARPAPAAQGSDEPKWASAITEPELRELYGRARPNALPPRDR